MNVVLWVVAAALAVAFAGAGLMKIAQPAEKLIAGGMGYVEDFAPPVIKLIGVLEVLAAIGLVGPPLLGFAEILTPLAATGLVLLMIGAIITHARRGETPMIVVNVVLLALAAFVAWGRFGPHSFT
ncbi:DoxX family protein [Spongisporangium articulatum]|uniref:DoxX family protein n=1 Tax=Spongisporangium articulatum TaxID=3362603 RepID=A0ABW8ATA2_9ACTN